METGQIHAKSESGRTAGAMDECITTCRECERICLETMQYCLKSGGRHAAQPHISTLMNCSEICGTSARFMIAGSPLHMETCRACAVVCRDCAKDCEQLAAEDRGMQRCADACKRCADSCDRMAAH